MSLLHDSMRNNALDSLLKARPSPAVFQLICLLVNDLPNVDKEELVDFIEKSISNWPDESRCYVAHPHEISELVKSKCWPIIKSLTVVDYSIEKRRSVEVRSTWIEAIDNLVSAGDKANIRFLQITSNGESETDFPLHSLADLPYLQRLVGLSLSIRPNPDNVAELFRLVVDGALSEIKELRVSNTFPSFIEFLDSHTASVPNLRKLHITSKHEFAPPIESTESPTSRFNRDFEDMEEIGAYLSRAHRLGEHLTELGLIDCSVGDKGLEQFLMSDHWNHLTSLSLSNSSITDESIPLLQKSRWLKDLVCLDLSKNELGINIIAGIAEIPFTRLTTLNLANIEKSDSAGGFSSYNDHSFDGWKAAPGLANLRKLSISGGGIVGSVAASAINKSRFTKQIEELELGIVTGDGLCEFTKCVFPSLTRLSFVGAVSENPVAKDEFQVFAASRAFPSIESLRMSYIRPDSNGMQTLLDSPHFRELHELSITTSRIRGVIGESFEQATECQLRFLDLSANGLQQDDIMGIANSDIARNIWQLDLSYTTLKGSCDFIAVSGKFISLIRLIINECRVDEDELAALHHSTNLPLLSQIDYSPSVDYGAI